MRAALETNDGECKENWTNVQCPKQICCCNVNIDTCQVEPSDVELPKPRCGARIYSIVAYCRKYDWSCPCQINKHERKQYMYELCSWSTPIATSTLVYLAYLIHLMLASRLYRMIEPVMIIVKIVSLHWHLLGQNDLVVRMFLDWNWQHITILTLFLASD